MKRKGFTLIELLGVIVVLAVIAIITTPVILGVIEKSKKGALQSSGYGLVETGILYHAEYQNSQTVRFDIKNNQIRTKEENKIDYKGSIKDGTILINNQGEVTVCINDGKYAAYKNYKDNKIIVVDQKTCTVPENNYIVYLDNESTAENNSQELIARLEKLETTIKEQAKEINALKSEKANTKEITNSINNLTATHNNDLGIIRSNINQLTENVSLVNNMVYLGETRDIQTAYNLKQPFTDFKKISIQIIFYSIDKTYEFRVTQELSVREITNMQINGSKWAISYFESPQKYVYSYGQFYGNQTFALGDLGGTGFIADRVAVWGIY